MSPRTLDRPRSDFSRAVHHLFDRIGMATALLLPFFLFVSVQTTCAQSRALNELLTPAEKEWLRNHTEVRVGLRKDFPPFEMLGKHGEFEGITIDYLGLIQARLGITFRMTSGQAWHELITRVKEQDLDVLPGLTATEKREAFLNFSQPFVEIPRVIITREDQQSIQSLNDLNGRPVAVVRGFAIFDWLEKDHPGIVLRPYVSPERALEALAFGHVEAYVSDLASAAYLINRLGLSQLKVAAHVPSTTALSIGVREDWPELVTILNKTIASITPQEAAEITNKWILLRQTGVTTRQALAVGVPIVFVAVLLPLLLINRRLRKEIYRRATVEKALREIEECFKRVLEGSTEGVCIQTEGRFEYVNGPALELFGAKDVGDLLGKPVIDRFPARLQPTAQERIRMLNVEKATVPHMEMAVLRMDGSEVHVEVSAIPIRFHGQDGALVFIRDITERKRMEGMRDEHETHLKEMVNERTAELTKSEMRIRSILETVVDGIVTIDEHGIVQTFNKAAARIFGYSSEEVCGHNVRMLMPEPYHSNHDGFIRRYLETGVPHVIGIGREVMGRRKDGSTFPLDLAVDEFSIGELRHFTGILRDITDRKRVSQELEEAKRAADAANRAKSDFLANMSHEIRTPLNAIIGFSNLALRTEMTPKQYDYLQKIQNQGISLLGIINDILDFSKIEAGKLEMERIDFDLDDVLNTVASIVSHKVHARELEFLLYMPFHIPNKIVGDPLRLTQVLTNLAENAVKFTEQGEVDISVSVLEQTEAKAKLRFDVRDTGIGMSEEQVSSLFEAFKQADTSTTRKYGGTGLGLSICKRLVEMMDGEISVESRLGEGSTFSFTAWFGLNIKGERQRRVIQKRLTGLRLLVVDERPEARDALTRRVEGLPLTVDSTGTVSEALEALRQHDAADPYDLVLMEWTSSGTDAGEAIRRIKTHATLKNVPAVLVVTAFGSDEVQAQAREAGADGLLTKPISASTLFDAIVGLFAPDASLSEGAPSSETIRTLDGSTVLLVEDNEINQQIAMELLAHAGVIAEIANNGREAVEKLKHAKGDSPYDLVLMDVQMPEMDGYEATRLIREESRFAGLPIIAMTSHAMAEEKRRCLEAGMNDHIAKPIDQETMLATMMKWYKPRTIRPVRFSPVLRVSSEEDVEVPGVPGIDVEDGLRRVAGNRSLYRQLLRKFGHENEHAAERIEDALRRNDRALAERLAHTVSGVAANIGAIDAHAVAAELENSLRNNDAPEQTRRLLERFAETVEPLASRLNTALEETPGAGQTAAAAPPDPTALKPVVDKLLALLKDSDSAAVDYAECFQGELIAFLGRTDFAHFEKALTSYDFDEALCCLEIAVNKLTGSHEETPR